MREHDFLLHIQGPCIRERASCIHLFPHFTSAQQKVELANMFIITTTVVGLLCFQSTRLEVRVSAETDHVAVANSVKLPPDVAAVHRGDGVVTGDVIVVVVVREVQEKVTGACRDDCNTNRHLMTITF